MVMSVNANDPKSQVGPSSSIAKMAWLNDLLAVFCSISSRPCHYAAIKIHTQRKAIAHTLARAPLDQRARPCTSSLDVTEVHRIAAVDIETAAPWQARVCAAPSAADPPRAGTAIEHVLVDAAAVGGLQAGPEVVHAGSRKRRNLHCTGHAGELRAGRGEVLEEVPCCRAGGGETRRREGEEGDEREHCGTQSAAEMTERREQRGERRERQYKEDRRQTGFVQSAYLELDGHTHRGKLELKCMKLSYLPLQVVLRSRDSASCLLRDEADRRACRSLETSLYIR